MWVSDCDSVVSALNRLILGKIQDKRLGIELAAMRQSLWRSPGKSKGDPRMDDERSENVTDVVLWVDTDVMLADPLTKKMEAITRWEALSSNYWDMKQPVESLRKKRLKQEQRRKTERFTEEEKQAMKKEWQCHSRNVFMNSGTPWSEVTWREVVDLDTGIVLEDKPKEAINKREMTKTLGKKMHLKISLHTDKDSYPYLPVPRSSEPGASQEDVYDSLGD